MATYICALIALLVAGWFAYWGTQGYRLSHRSGYYAPLISVVPRLLRWISGCIASRLFIGPLQIIGDENIRNCDGRLIVTPKHVYEADAILVARLARSRKLRFLIAINQTAGLRSLPLAWMGAISVGYDKNNPVLSAANAARSAIKAMTAEEDSLLVIFPEGKLDKGNTLVRANYHDGAVRIGKACQKASKQDWYLMPTDIEYLTDPKYATLFQRTLKKIGIARRFFGNTIYGAKITFGSPIKISNLPNKDKEGTDILFDAMVGIRAKSRSIEAA